MRRAVSVLLPLAVVLAGCPSSTIMHTAKPVRTGVTQIGINAVGYSPQTDAGGAVVPTFEVQARRGLSDSSDIGVRYSFPLTLTVDYNLLVANGAVPISIDPTLAPTYFSFTDTTTDQYGNSTNQTVSLFMLYGYLPVLFDVISTDSLALTLSPRVGFWYASAAVSGDSTLAANSGVSWVWGMGAGLRIGGHEGFAVMPEVSLLAPFEGGGAIVQGALGFLF